MRRRVFKCVFKLQCMSFWRTTGKILVYGLRPLCAIFLVLAKAIIKLDLYPNLKKSLNSGYMYLFFLLQRYLEIAVKPKWFNMIFSFLDLNISFPGMWSSTLLCEYLNIPKICCPPLDLELIWPIFGIFHQKSIFIQLKNSHILGCRYIWLLQNLALR